ncbi:C5a anaphylatoxin chemotactic receptor 1-like [Spea bombifrons]|uniref:C5a anaphylatoxin chemotactic receptor 1-like n=1 Tax=Spea bombifrons TaxID=233779 RepID=UPI00234A89CE|nr:C5a anaphylatoxin chemotactic receptor 1-like [Spea bombifrons]
MQTRHRMIIYVPAAPRQSLLSMPFISSWERPDLVTIEEKYSGSVQYASFVLSVIICVVGLIGNVVVLGVTGFIMKKRQSRIWFLNLAVADLVFLLSLNIDRALAIAKPIWHHKSFSPKARRRICAIIWSVTVLSSIPAIFLGGEVETKGKTECSLFNIGKVNLDTSAIALKSLDMGTINTFSRYVEQLPESFYRVGTSRYRMRRDRSTGKRIEPELNVCIAEIHPTRVGSIVEKVVPRSYSSGRTLELGVHRSAQ